MGLVELFLTGVGLSMDAFAVSVCKGLNMRKINIRHSIVIALFFGGFQALMPLIGWALGRQFEQYITAVDHWIAFALLAFIGGKMAYEAIKGGDDNSDKSQNKKTQDADKLDLKELFLLAIATSIDALAVGITFAFLQVSILPSITVIGVTTFLFSVGGVVIGNRFGVKYKSKAELAGGIILILIGLKILLEGVGVIG